MPVNESQIRSQRQWEIWRSSGAVGIHPPEQPLVTLPSWHSIFRKLDEVTFRDSVNPNLNRLLKDHRMTARDYYDARFDIAAGKGDERLKQLVEDHTKNENSDVYDPLTFNLLMPIFEAIDSAFPYNPPQE